MLEGMLTIPMTYATNASLPLSHKMTYYIVLHYFTISMQYDPAMLQIHETHYFGHTESSGLLHTLSTHCMCQHP